MTLRGFVMALRVLGVIVAVGGAVVASAGAASAGAGAGEGGEGTYEVSAQVRFTGDAAPAGGSVQAVSIPVVCAWRPVATKDDGRMGWPGVAYFDPENPEETLEARASAMSYNSVFPGRIPEYTLPTVADIEQAIADKAAGLGPSLFYYDCLSNTDVYFDKVDQGQIFMAYFNDPEPVPPPEVDPEDLADAAYDAMVLPVPTVDRNPLITSTGAGAATLVNLPTWFWVTDPAAVGGDNGTRTIRAEVEGTGVFAELTARTQGLSISSPAGGTQCSPTRAQVRYAPGVADGDACTVAFRKASSGDGFPVTASAAWTAVWTGQNQSGATVGGNLGGTTRSEVVTVPVQESQSVVVGIR